MQQRRRRGSSRLARCWRHCGGCRHGRRRHRDGWRHGDGAGEACRSGNACGGGGCCGNNACIVGSAAQVRARVRTAAAVNAVASPRRAARERRARHRARSATRARHAPRVVDLGSRVAPTARAPPRAPCAARARAPNAVHPISPAVPVTPGAWNCHVTRATSEASNANTPTSSSFSAGTRGHDDPKPLGEALKVVGRAEPVGQGDATRKDEQMIRAPHQILRWPDHHVRQDGNRDLHPQAQGWSSRRPRHRGHFSIDPASSSATGAVGSG